MALPLIVAGGAFIASGVGLIVGALGAKKPMTWYMKTGSKEKIEDKVFEG